MPILVICCLLLVFLLKSQSVYLPLLLNQWVWGGAAGLALLCFAGGCGKKLSSSVWHDGYASAMLWVWYGTWQPLFSTDAPMFFWFPIYFAVLTAWLSWGLIGKAARFDRDSLEALRYFQTRLARFDTRLIAVLLFIAVLVPEHYLLYPLAMTLFAVRYTFQRCLEIADGE
ncbi:MAG: hypothetical protein ACU836_00415 [Gammaproteobacteria bacterium]